MTFLSQTVSLTIIFVELLGLGPGDLHLYNKAMFTQSLTDSNIYLLPSAKAQ